MKLNGQVDRNTELRDSVLGKCRKETCLLSSLLSMRSCVWLAEVRAENIRKWVMYLRGKFFKSLSVIVRVFPVPVGPMQRT